MQNWLSSVCWYRITLKELVEKAWSWENCGDSTLEDIHPGQSNWYNVEQDNCFVWSLQVPTNANHSVIEVLQILPHFRIPCLDGDETLTALSILRQAMRQGEGGLKGAYSRAINESWAVHKTAGTQTLP